MQEVRDDLDCETTLEMIGAAVMAGAYRTLARTTPEAQSGMLKMAAKHSARVGALASAFCERRPAQ